MQEIQEVFESHPWLPPPTDVVMIADGDIVTEQGTAVGVTPLGFRVIVLTPVADQETVMHEWVHTFGFREQATQMITPWVMKKPAIRQRMLNYEHCTDCSQHGGIDETLAMHGINLQQVGGEYSYPDLKHYKLV